MTLTQINSKGIKDGEILNADINASAAIDGSKLNPVGLSNVGIGTSSPSDNLEISSTVPTIRLTDTDGGPSYSQIKGPGNGDLRISCDVGNTSSSASEIQFDIHDSNKMVIQSTGNVGIGTSTPNYELQVNDPSGAVSAIQLTNTSTGTSNSDGFLIYNHGVNALVSNEEIGSLKFQTSGLQRLVIESDGKIDLEASVAKFGNSHSTGTTYLFGNDIRFTNEGITSTKMVLDSSGRVLIGGATSINASTNADDLQVGASSQSNQTGITLGSTVASSLRFMDVANDTAGYILYNHGNDEFTLSSTGTIAFSANGGNAANIDSSGNLQIVNGHLKVASGKGIDFGAVSDGSRSVSSNLFDDYEEGTWTPTIGGSTTQGSATMATQAGRYVKAGKLVTVSCYIGWNSFTGSGALNIYGLPFTCWNDAHAGAVMTKDLTFPSGAFYLSTHTWANVSYFRLYSSASNATWNYVTCDSTGNLICTMTYFAA